MILGDKECYSFIANYFAVRSMEMDRSDGGLPFNHAVIYNVAFSFIIQLLSLIHI